MLTWDMLSPDCQRRNQHLRDDLSVKAAKPNKFGAEKVYLDGMVFDSKKEAAKYGELLLLKRAGIVTEFKHHPRAFVLKEGYRCQQTRQWIRPITYTPDFWVKYADGREVWVETKGMKTEAYILRRKLFRDRYPDLIFEEE